MTAVNEMFLSFCYGYL